MVCTTLDILTEEVKSLLRIGAGEVIWVCVLTRARLNIGGAKANIYQRRGELVEVANDVTHRDVATVAAFRLVRQGHQSENVITDARNLGVTTWSGSQ